MITIKNMNFKYKNSETIFEDATCTLFKDNVYFLEGKNGVGKTTLARLLLKINKPNSGEVLFHDINTVSYLPDFNGLYPQLTVIENIMYRLALYNQDYTKYKDTITDLLHKYQLYKYKDTLVSMLSLGTTKKVAILCVILIESDLLILDEPTGGLDKKASNEVIKMLKEIKNQNSIVVCISHDDALKTNCTKILTIKDKSIYEYNN